MYALICDETRSGEASHHSHHNAEGSRNDISSEPTTSATGGPRGDELPSRLIFDELVGQVAKVSISHDGDYATAVCLAVNEPVSGDVGGEAAARMP